MTEAITPKSGVPLDILNARLFGYKGLQQILIDSQGIIKSILSMDVVFKKVPSADLQVLDVAGDLVSLGGVDLQINGALGLAFPDLNRENCDRLPEIGKFLWDQGVDGFLPTIVTTSVENIQSSLAVLGDFVTSPFNKAGGVAQILGVHLEGPFLNPQKRGAHPAEYLLPLTIDNMKRVLGDYAQIVRAITLAPELDDTGEVIPYLRSLGITVSLGHSQATAAQAEQAFQLGASMVTHAFNAMPSLHHREPGLLGAAIVHPEVKCGLIADGQHVCPTMIQMLLRASNYEQGIFLVSDALAPLGLPDGVYPWDSRQIEVKDGTARLPDGTLSGTTLPLLVGVQNLAKWGVCEVESAVSVREAMPTRQCVAQHKVIALATEAPRRAIGLPGLSAGQPAYLLRWHLNRSTGELNWQRLLPYG